MAPAHRNHLSPTDAASRAERLHLVGGRLCLDFANTMSGRGTDQLQEHLTSYPALLAWAAHTGTLGGEDEAALERLAGRQAKLAQEVLRQAMELRDTVHRIFGAIAHGREAEAADIDTLNEWLARVMVHARLAPAEGGFDWSWAEPRRSLDSVLWPIVRSVAETLTVAPHSRIRQCPGADCGWLFLDTSKAGRRRWCDMNVCGNRSKAREHYRRTKGAVQRPKLVGGTIVSR
jgi:predicted RNA-binding Zn ribbon-like protein